MTTANKNERVNLWDSLGRATALKTEIAELRTKGGELEALKEREDALAKELAEVERALGAPAAQEPVAPAPVTPKTALRGPRRGKKRRLGMLEDLRLASPCPASWDEMLGDRRVRFCTGCEKNVYNISAMGREEAEDLIAEKEGDLCVRFFQRADGTIMTADCSVGAKKKLRKKVALAVATAGAMALAAIGVHNRDEEARHQSLEGINAPDIHEVLPVQPPPSQPPVQPNINDVIGDDPLGHWAAGGIGQVLPPPVPSPPKKLTR